MSNVKLPKATIKRLPLYYRYMQKMQASGTIRVSSAEISKRLQLDAATVRRDFSHFGNLGTKGLGYDVNKLLQFFSKLLNQDEVAAVALVGAGNLGTALLLYNSMRKDNTVVKMAFDIESEKVGTTIGDTPIYHLDQLEARIAAEQIEVAILTVPSTVAQAITDRLIRAGVKAILNFTPARLKVPTGVHVNSINFSIELQSLLYLLKNYH